MKGIPLLLVTLVALNYPMFSQTPENSGGYPDLPGTFVLEWGFNGTRDTPKNFSTALLGSRTINIYYQHPFKIPILKNKLSFVPGFGVGLDQFKLTTGRTLAFESGSLTMSKMELDISKSKLNANYFDIPIEIRYTSNPDDPKRSFNLSLGFRTGTLMSSYTKIVYDDDEGEKVKDKRKRDWNLSKFRYGIYGKIGFGNFTFFTYSNVSTLFRSGKGPDDHDVSTVTFGISLASF